MLLQYTNPICVPKLRRLWLLLKFCNMDKDYVFPQRGHPVWWFTFRLRQVIIYMGTNTCMEKARPAPQWSKWSHNTSVADEEWWIDFCHLHWICTVHHVCKQPPYLCLPPHWLFNQSRKHGVHWNCYQHALRFLLRIHIVLPWPFQNYKFYDCPPRWSCQKGIRHFCFREFLEL